MGLLTPEESFQSAIRELGRTGVAGQQERARFLPTEVNARYSFMEQVGANFMHENLAVVAGMNFSDPEFAEVPGYNPAPDLGFYEEFVGRYPSLMLAKSPLELEYIKNRVDRDIEQRRAMAQGGFLRQLAAGLPAGLLSPENLIPFGRAVRGTAAAARAAKAAEVAAKGASKEFSERLALRAAGVFSQAGRTGLEGGLTQAIAEIGLGAFQESRTLQEKTEGVMAAAAFGSILGAAGSTMGALKREFFLKVLGEETTEGALVTTAQRVLGPAGVLSEGSELGIKFRSQLQEFDDFADLVKNGEIEDATSRLHGMADDVHGTLMEALASDNPNLARLLGMEKRLGRMITKLMFLNPGGRLARNKLSSANKFANIFVRNALTEENVGAAAIEPILQIAQVHLFKSLAELRNLYVGNKKGALADLTEEEFYDMVGFAARNGGVDESMNLNRADGELVPIFEKVKGNADAVRLIEEAANIYHGFSESMVKLGSESGAYTPAALERGLEDMIWQGLDDRYVTRQVNKTVALKYGENLKNRVRMGLEEQRERLVKSGFLQKHIDREQAKLDRAEAERRSIDPEDDPVRRRVLQNQIEANQKRIDELNELVESFDRNFEDLVESVYQNYVGDPSKAPMGTGSSGNPIKQRVLRIPDQYLEGFLVQDVRQLMGRQTRSLLPDLVIGRRMQMYMNGRDLASKTNADLNRVIEMRDRAAEEGREFTKAELEQIQDTLDEALADAAYMNLVDSVRLLASYERVFDDIDGNATDAGKKIQDRLYVMRDERVNAQKRLRQVERELVDLEQQLADEIIIYKEHAKSLYGDHNLALANARRALNAGTATDPLLLELAEALAPLWDAQRRQADLQESLLANKNEMHRILQMVHDQNTKDVNFDVGQAGFVTTRWNPVISEDGADNFAQFDYEIGGAIDTISRRRSQSFAHNLDTLQLVREMQREARREVNAGRMTEAEANRLLYGKEPLSGKIDPSSPRAGSAVDDLLTVHARLRMRHGSTAEGWRYVGKAARDLNFTRAMGGVLISSLPDMAMAIGQAGLWNYMKTMERYLRKDFNIRAKDPRGRSDLATLMWSMETVIGQERTRTLYGIDDEFTEGAAGMDPGRSTRWARRADNFVQNFSKMTLIDKWNGLNKGIAAMALQHRAADVSVRLAKGEAVKEYELNAVLGYGYTKTQLKAFGKQIIAKGEQDTTRWGSFWYSKSADWEDRELALTFDAGVVKAVSDTVITPGAGDLPTSATKSEVGRLFFQFRNFTMAANQRMLIPAMQKFYKWQDPNIPIQMVSMWILGMGVYAINEVLKGNDPFKAIETREGEKRGAWRRWVMDGLDRSGALGIATEVNAMSERSGFPGLGDLLGAPPPSRFRGRGQWESFVGPGFGTMADAFSAVAGISDANITNSEGNLYRRMTPYQNWWGTRLLLDVAPNALDGGGYFDNFQPIQTRVRGWIVGDEEQQ